LIHAVAVASGSAQLSIKTILLADANGQEIQATLVSDELKLEIK
jgi:hypothetical protein